VGVQEVQGNHQSFDVMKIRRNMGKTGLALVGLAPPKQNSNFPQIET